MKDTRVFAQKLLEHIQFGLTSLFGDKDDDKSTASSVLDNRHLN